MAIKSTIIKVNLQIADMERHYYKDHALTIAQHPSETDERMMMRLLAFGLHAHEYLEFGQGMTDDDEADLWQKDLTSAIELWIDVGMPDEKLAQVAGFAATILRDEANPKSPANRRISITVLTREGEDRLLKRRAVAMGETADAAAPPAAGASEAKH